MKMREFISSKAVTLCFLGIGMVLAGILLKVAGNSWQMVFMTGLLALLLILCWLAVSYVQESSKLKRLEKIIDQLEEKYLLGEVVPEPAGGTERRYFEIMKTISRSAIGAVEDARREQEGYQDYVENWIHEIKTPLTACSLILDNDADVRKLRRELKRADNLTENILYYARMRTAEKDLQIRQVQISEIMEEAVKSQMELLIAAGVSIETHGDFKVHTDGKSVLFILKQLLINCGKYCPGCHVKMTAKEGIVTVEDNGIGIPSHEVGRVTDRGFSGTNGRALGKSTGMGLYIVKELCNRLDIRLSIDSERGKYTRISLRFRAH
ncbi:MAG: sensor histidine kinase [Bacillota bacterium]|nr:sensor histidine kinase [Bacillota bacterium]